MEPLILSKLSNTHHSFHQLTKFLGSVFFFSVLLLCSSLIPFLFNFIQFCSCNIGKNYIFLICNGILVLIVKNSGLMSNSHQESNLINNGGIPKKTEENALIDVKEVQEVESKSKCLINVPLITQDVEDKIASIIDEDQEEEEEEEEEEIGLLSAEELNKKCEDFIRKMKEEIKFDAQIL